MRSAEWLRSQGLGLACGLATVVLLGVGSVTIAATREGASAAVGIDDLRGFFDPPSWTHLWLYLLFPVAALYALNATLATWDTVVRRWRAGVRAPSAYAASILHVGFLLALAAHAIGGFLGREGGTVVVGPGWTEVPGFGSVRLVSLRVDELPNGMPRAAEARLEVRDASGSVAPAAVGYNAPLTSGAGSRLALLADFGRVLVARVASGAERCALAEGEACTVGGEPVRALAVRAGPGGRPSALLRARGASGAPEVRWAAPDDLVALAGGRPLAVEAVAPEPAIALRVRAAPGTPWALAAAIALAAGVALLWRRLAARWTAVTAGTCPSGRS
jgi:hypothetical protein